MVRDSADGREPIRRGVFHDDSLGRRRVRTRQSVGGVPCAVVGYYIFLAAGQRTERPARVR